MNFPHSVTFTEPSEVRLPSGGVTYTYAPIVDLTDVPARIVPEQIEQVAPTMTLETDRFTLVLQGDRAIERPMRAVSDYLDCDLSVVRVQRPVLYRSPMTNCTIVTAERITATGEAGS